jgi:hypothetical protein
LKLINRIHPGTIKDVGESPPISNTHFKVSSMQVSVETDTVGTLVSAFQKGLGGRKVAMDFKFKDMSLSLPNGKQILSGVNGYVTH